MYVQINFGRNIGTEPMDDGNWGWFQDTVKDTLASAVRVWNNVPRSDILAMMETHLGTGSWALGAEESAHVSIFWDGPIDLDYLREQLGYVGRIFEQESIALIVGSELIPGKVWERRSGHYLVRVWNEGEKGNHTYAYRCSCGHVERDFIYDHYARDGHTEHVQGA